MRRLQTNVPALLHPGLADPFQGNISDLNTALNDPSLKTEVTLIIRSLLSEIRIILDNGTLGIELVAGELAGLYR